MRWLWLTSSSTGTSGGPDGGCLVSMVTSADKRLQIDGKELRIAIVSITSFDLMPEERGKAADNEHRSGGR